MSFLRNMMFSFMVRGHLLDTKGRLYSQMAKVSLTYNLYYVFEGLYSNMLYLKSHSAIYMRPARSLRIRSFTKNTNLEFTYY